MENLSDFPRTTQPGEHELSQPHVHLALRDSPWLGDTVFLQNGQLCPGGVPVSPTLGSISPLRAALGVRRRRSHFRLCGESQAA